MKQHSLISMALSAVGPSRLVVIGFCCLLVLLAGPDSACLAVAGFGTPSPVSSSSQGDAEDDELFDLAEAGATRRNAPRTFRPTPASLDRAQASSRPRFSPRHDSGHLSANLVGELANRNGVGAPLLC
jgi:hypothetical protein